MNANKVVSLIKYEDGNYYIDKNAVYSNNSDSIFFNSILNGKILDSYSVDCTLNCTTIYRIKFRKALFYRVKILKKEKIISVSSFDTN